MEYFLYPNGFCLQSVIAEFYHPIAPGEILFSVFLRGSFSSFDDFKSSALTHFLDLFKVEV